jgi:hypothetical protein
MRITEELLECKTSGFSLEKRLRTVAFHCADLAQKLALASQTNGGHLFNTVACALRAMELVQYSCLCTESHGALFASFYAMTTYRDVNIEIHVFLASTLVGDELLASEPSNFTSTERASSTD